MCMRIICICVYKCYYIVVVIYDSDEFLDVQNQIIEHRTLIIYTQPRCIIYNAQYNSKIVPWEEGGLF